MKIKVCGLMNKENIDAVGQLRPDFMGFIFYEGSKRFVGHDFCESQVRNIPKSVKKVGVFVDESAEIIMGWVHKLCLDMIQLHGEETPMECKAYREMGLGVIKSITVMGESDTRIASYYRNCVDYVLFDAPGANYGGNGVTFNWGLLRNFGEDTPFILSGGIGLDEIDALQNVGLYPAVIDINSHFEIKPGEKNVANVERAIQKSREMS